MKTKWMYMIFMLALAFNLSACGNNQENRNSSEDGTLKIEPKSEEDDLPKDTPNKSSDIDVIDPQDNDTDKKIMKVGTIKDSAYTYRDIIKANGVID